VWMCCIHTIARRRCLPRQLCEVWIGSDAAAAGQNRCFAAMQATLQLKQLCCPGGLHTLVLLARWVALAAQAAGVARAALLGKLAVSSLK
jgi:hypothetical protein